ncbi:MAG: transposase [Verrucomicrobiae bacterium]|nr:transposase [Verrucomicrobiae bacterium]
MPRGRPAFLLTLHTFGEYLDFHPHIHALVAEGVLYSEGQWHPAPEIAHAILESAFRDRIFAELLRMRRISPPTGGAHARLEAHRIQRGRRPECVPGESR